MSYFTHLQYTQDPSRFRFRRLGRQTGMPKVAEKIIWIICIWQGCVGSIQWMLLPWWVPGVHWHLGHGRRSFLRGREACSRAHGFFVHDGKGGQLPLIQGLDPKTAGQKAKDYAETVNIAYVLPFRPSYRGPQYTCRLATSVDFMDQQCKHVQKMPNQSPKAVPPPQVGASSSLFLWT